MASDLCTLSPRGCSRSSVPVRTNTQNGNIKCNDVIKACDNALAAKDKVIADASKESDMLMLQNKALQASNAELEASNSKFYKNPFWMGLIGFTVGLLAYAYVKH